jgi:DNA polymerase III subunit delta'
VTETGNDVTETGNDVGAGHTVAPGALWDDIVGQAAAVAQLRAAADRGPVHAYLFVGPAGSTKLQAARAFAARVISGGEDPEQRDARLILAAGHADVREIRRAGASISAEQAREIVRLASMAPTEGDRKVLILDEFHLLRPEGAALMLKTIEEPPPSTMFIILCDFVPNDLITISSRCVRIEFRSISSDVVAARLVDEGVDPVAARQAATAALGDLDRARVLATDPDLAARRTAFARVPHELNGSGAVAMRTAAALLEMIDAAAAPLTARHDTEVAALDAQIAAFGERGSGRKQLEERHKRELRRHRTDELRAGLATLAATYRDSLVTAAAGVDVTACAAAVRRVHDTLESLERNPNERLLVEALLWSLPDAHGVR